MAYKIINDNVFTNIGDAIRAKTHDTAKLKPADMAAVIKTISNGNNVDLTGLNSEVNKLSETTGDHDVEELTNLVKDANDKIDDQSELLNQIALSLENKSSGISSEMIKKIEITNIIKSSEIIKSGDTITFDVINNSSFSNESLIIEGILMAIPYSTYSTMSCNFNNATYAFYRKYSSEVAVRVHQLNINSNIITVTLSFNASTNMDGVDPFPKGILVCTPDYQDFATFQFSVWSYACLIEDTLITLVDGTQKPIQDITYEDELLVWDFYNGCFTAAKPNWIKIEEIAQEYNELTFSDGTILGLVGNGKIKDSNKAGYHRIFNKQAGAFTHTGTNETPIGTVTFNHNGKEVELVSQKIIYKPTKFYNLTTDKYYNCFANSILTSCRLSNEYKIENMEYIGNRLITNEEIDNWYKEHNLIKKED